MQRYSHSHISTSNKPNLRVVLRARWDGIMSPMMLYLTCRQSPPRTRQNWESQDLAGSRRSLGHSRELGWCHFLCCEVKMQYTSVIKFAFSVLWFRSCHRTYLSSLKVTDCLSSLKFLVWSASTTNVLEADMLGWTTKQKLSSASTNWPCSGVILLFYREKYKNILGSLHFSTFGHTKIVSLVIINKDF